MFRRRGHSRGGYNITMGVGRVSLIGWPYLLRADLASKSQHIPYFHLPFKAHWLSKSSSRIQHVPLANIRSSSL